MRSYLKSTGDKEIDEIMAMFNYAYLAAFPNFERMERIQKAYGNKTSSLAWPTIANCSIPLTFMSVEEQLPQAMKYLFPKNKAIVRLIPERGMDRDKVKLVEASLRYTTRTQMKCQTSCFPSIKDCYKFAVGYGLADTEMITPPEVKIMQADEEGVTVARIPQLELGIEKQIPSYIYTPPISVIPLPGGANVDGPNRVDHFVIVFITEGKFRSMYKQKGLDGKPLLRGDVEKIIKEARALNFDYRMPTPDMIASLAGIQITKTNNGDKKMPVLVPVLRLYKDHHQIWLANGRTKIYEVKEKYQTLRSDLIKWSAWPDGNDWFPLGVTEASENVALGTNIWYNGLIDLAMYHINPVRLVNTRMIEDPRTIARNPKSDIKVNGVPEQAIGYLKLPEFPAQLFSMGDAFQRFHANANGIMSGAQERSPGMVRGGANAFEELISSTTGRQFLAAIMLQTGGLEQLMEKTLIKKQLIMSEEGEAFVEEAYDPATGDYFYDEKTVTLDDIRHVFRVELNLPEPKLNENSDFMKRAGVFDRAQKNLEMFDVRALYEYLAEDDDAVRRMMLPEDVVKERQERMAQARMVNVEAGAEPEGNTGSIPTQGEEAMAGAMSLLPNV